MLPEEVNYTRLIGRSYRQVNCWQLVREFYWLVFGLELKNYVDGTPDDKVEIKNLIHTNVGDFIEVGEPKFGDLILFKIHGIESHIGVYVGPGRFLHSSKTTGSVIDSLSKWSKVVVGYYRHTIGELSPND